MHALLAISASMLAIYEQQMGTQYGSTVQPMHILQSVVCDV